MPRPRKNNKKDSRKRRTRPALSRFELLPHDIILKIFNDCNLYDRCPESLSLSRQLLPVALEGFYSKVDIFSPTQCVDFYAHIRHRPRLGESVRLLVISSVQQRLTWKIPEDVEMELVPKLSRAARRKLQKSKKETDKKETKNLESLLPPSKGNLNPSLFVFCGDLFRDMFARLPNLTNLILSGQAFASSLFHCDDELLRELLPRLKFFNIFLRDEEDFAVEDHSICARLSQLARLECAMFTRNLENSPFAAPDQLTASQLRPESWNLEDFALVGMEQIGDLGTLFRSFTSSLRSIHLDSKSYWSNLVDSFRCLPSSLQSVYINFGLGQCSFQFEKASLSLDDVVPPVDDGLHHLVNLEDLGLKGPVVSSKVYQAFFKFKKLRSLSLNLHVPLDGTQLLSLVSGPRQLPALEKIDIDICHCPVEENPGIRRPRWTPEFTLTLASRCLREMRKRGIEAEGNWKCAARFCDREDGHDCSMSLPPII